MWIIKHIAEEQNGHVSVIAEQEAPTPEAAVAVFQEMAGWIYAVEPVKGDPPTTAITMEWVGEW